MTVFLTGKSGVGKSTCIIKFLKEYCKKEKKTIGGYLTHRCFYKDRIVGYGICRAEPYIKESESFYPPVIYFEKFPDEKEQEEYKMFQVHGNHLVFSMERFRKYTDSYLEEDGDIILCDELGGMDFIDDDFVGKILNLSKEKIMIGVYREIDDYESFFKRRDLSLKEQERIIKNRSKFEDHLKGKIINLKDIEGSRLFGN
ncbi:MAG: nucleoside-triphosphatase [Gallicola sp.]|nr:nucleoside-triphosphatase [Gallicola sp.]